MNEDYIQRINKVLLFIDKHLESDLSLESVSNVAFYSPFHLHRLFKAITNETLNAYITRKRIEKAVYQLLHKKDLTISEIALQTGFNSNSSFTRTFTKLYGMSPSTFRKTTTKKISKIGKADSKNGKADLISQEYLYNIIHLKTWINMQAKIEIKEMPKLNLAYLTHIGVNGLEDSFERIVKWARSKALLGADDANIVRIFHDSFKITDERKVRMSIGVSTKHPVKPEGEIGSTTVEQGKCIVGRFEIEPKDFETSWDGLFIWMNEQGYKKAERNPYEIYYNNYKEHPLKKCIVDLCIPID